MPAPETVLGQRALNRALLARQLLLRRERRPVREVVAHLVGLQGQAPMPAYQGLWSRIEGFDPHELGRMLSEGEAVRLVLMRGTLHLVTTEDALFLRPLVQDMLERMYGPVARDLGEARSRLPDEVRAMLAERPAGARELARGLVERGIGTDVERIGYAIPAFVPLVQLPPRGVWGATGRVRYAPLEAWAGTGLQPDPPIEDLVLRYLGAFGPASVMDMQSWSGLTRLKGAFERLRPRLATFRDQQGRELFDLPHGPRPHPDVPAPVRLLGEYDNALLGHDDRSRIIPEGFPWDEMLAHGRFVNNLLVDGMLRATWWLEREGKRRATLGIRPFGKLSAAERRAVAEEAEAMLAFAAADAEPREVRFEDPVS